ncbi:16S rRNA (cytidine(1402)-2'-O)-methyltransferase [Bacillus sp. 165]|uniref:16S rRNA (cytidine(1402)-2'-O)-methyltransferase n=1 Tax=Bacillus sp. 165 TaxID=1529117 RepID=UPI001ADA56E4|nr:16S rRNA (cytidine(1402)-2'-O)-methyltransferase [Bacillus sp. 165]MBO9131286.1 16S rRNA (cytidine(1402)-2'-O)-methyltransferase [Bacillus sp. 165]
MLQQKSFRDETRGTLFLVPTPIGNLEDITFRAIRILKEADYIAAEDTRQTKKLCHYFEIETPLISYHEHNKETAGDKIIQLVKEGKKIALVSDAGMPCISDPGYELVAQAVKEEQIVVPLPGANAALTALIASGLPARQFHFYGFLDRQKKEKKMQLEAIKYIKETIIFYEAPHRLKETLSAMLEVLGNRQIVLCRELTKKFEEFIRGSIEEAIQWTNEEEVRGEFCLLIEGSFEEIQEEIWWDSLSILEHIEYYIEQQQMSSKDAIKAVAKDRDMAKREVYQLYHIE